MPLSSRRRARADRYDRSTAATDPIPGGEMTAGGLEIPIAKAAASAVSRTAGPAWRRYSRSRNLKRAAEQLDLSEVTLPKLTPDQGTSVSEYVASRDFHVIATQVALSALEEKAGRAVTVQENVITDQLTKALRARGKWEPGILRQVVDVLKQDLGRAVIAILQQMTDAGSSASELAAYVENAGDHATAALRNSNLPQGINGLPALHRFECEIRGQVGDLSQTMRVPNADALKFVPFDALYVEPSLQFTRDIDPDGFGRSGITQAVTVQGSELFDTSDRVVVLGDPGSGKSTLAAKTVHDLVNNPAGPVPLLLALRHYVEEFRARKSTIAYHLADLCRSRYQVEPPSDALEYLLLNGRALVIFDGLDEIFDAGVREQVIEALHGFAHRYPNTPILITSRRVGYAE